MHGDVVPLYSLHPDERELRTPAGFVQGLVALAATRTYKDEAGDYHDSSSFSGSELLRIAHLAKRAYDATSELRECDAS